MFVSVSHLNPSLKFVDKATSLKAFHSGSVEPGLQILDQGGGDKHSNLLWYRIMYRIKKYVQVPGAKCLK